MPFLRDCKSKKEKPLQVSNVSLSDQGNKCTRPEKRAVLSPFRQYGGSMALEATLVLWMFIVFSVSLMMPMEFVQVRLRVQAALEEQLRMVCSRVEETDESIRTRWEWLEGSCVLGGLDGMQINCVSNEDSIELDAAYYVMLPFSLFGKRKFLIQNSCSGRIWDGDSEAELWNLKNGSETVYITPYGTVFHWYQDCVSLDIAVYGIDAGQLESARNDSGGRYYPCRYCTSGVHESESGIRYITKYGQRYHVDRGCSRLNRTVTAILQKDVEGRHICERCRKRKEGGT